MASADKDAFSRLYKKTEFDNLLNKLGGWGRFQQIQWLLLFIAAIPQAWYTYAPAFAAAKPKPDQIYCVEQPRLKGEAFCGAWQNGSCKDAGYNTPYTSIVTDVSVSSSLEFSCGDILFLVYPRLTSLGHASG